jgi:hypothetical protein
MATLYGPADSGGGHGDSNKARMTQIQPETTDTNANDNRGSHKFSYPKQRGRPRNGRPMNRMSQIEPETAMLGNLHLLFANMDLRVETIASPPRGNISTKMPISGDRYILQTKRSCRNWQFSHKVCYPKLAVVYGAPFLVHQVLGVQRAQS